MLKFLDGPASGQVLTCARAPLFLRVVQSKDGTWDALDLLRDIPEPDDVIHVYVKVHDRGSVHYDGCDSRGRRFGRTEQTADYRVYEVQPIDLVVRDMRCWRGWCAVQKIVLEYKKNEDVVR